MRKEIIDMMEKKYDSARIQSTAIKVKTKGQHITTSAIYCPPEENLKSGEYYDF